MLHISGSRWRWKFRKILLLLLLLVCINYSAQDCQLDCIHVLTAPEGSFWSPCYPSDYPKNLACRWTLQAPPGFIVQVAFLDFELEEALGCIYDRVVVSTGTSNVTFCGITANGLTLNSTGNVMEVSFTSDFSVQKRGFNVSYRQVAVALRNQKVALPQNAGKVMKVSSQVDIPNLQQFTVCFEVARTSQKKGETIFTYTDPRANTFSFGLSSSTNMMVVTINGQDCAVSAVLTEANFTAAMKPFCITWSNLSGKLNLYFDNNFQVVSCSASMGAVISGRGAFQLGYQSLSFDGFIYNFRLWNYAMTKTELSTLSCDVAGNVIDWDNAFWVIPSGVAQTDSTLSCICYPNCTHLTTAAPSSGTTIPYVLPTASCTSPGRGCPAALTSSARGTIVTNMTVTNPYTNATTSMSLTSNMTTVQSSSLPTTSAANIATSPLIALAVSESTVASTSSATNTRAAINSMAKEEEKTVTFWSVLRETEHVVPSTTHSPQADVIPGQRRSRKFLGIISTPLKWPMKKKPDAVTRPQEKSLLYLTKPLVVQATKVADTSPNLTNPQVATTSSVARKTNPTSKGTTDMRMVVPWQQSSAKNRSEDMESFQAAPLSNRKNRPLAPQQPLSGVGKNRTQIANQTAAPEYTSGEESLVLEMDMQEEGLNIYDLDTSYSFVDGPTTSYCTTSRSKTDITSDVHAPEFGRIKVRSITQEVHRPALSTLISNHGEDQSGSWTPEGTHEDMESVCTSGADRGTNEMHFERRQATVAHTATLWPPLSTSNLVWSSVKETAFRQEVAQPFPDMLILGHRNTKGSGDSLAPQGQYWSASPAGDMSSALLTPVSFSDSQQAHLLSSKTWSPAPPFSFELFTRGLSRTEPASLVSATASSAIQASLETPHLSHRDDAAQLPQVPDFHITQLEISPSPPSKFSFEQGCNAEIMSAPARHPGLDLPVSLEPSLVNFSPQASFGTSNPTPNPYSSSVGNPNVAQGWQGNVSSLSGILELLHNVHDVMADRPSSATQGFQIRPKTVGFLSTSTTQAPFFRTKHVPERRSSEESVEDLVPERIEGARPAKRSSAQERATMTLSGVSPSSQLTASLFTFILPPPLLQHKQTEALYTAEKHGGYLSITNLWILKSSLAGQPHLPLTEVLKYNGFLLSEPPQGAAPGPLPLAAPQTLFSHVRYTRTDQPLAELQSSMAVFKDLDVGEFDMTGFPYMEALLGGREEGQEKFSLYTQSLTAFMFTGTRSLAETELDSTLPTRPTTEFLQGPSSQGHLRPSQPTDPDKVDSWRAATTMPAIPEAEPVTRVTTLKLSGDPWDCEQNDGVWCSEEEFLSSHLPPAANSSRQEEFKAVIGSPEELFGPPQDPSVDSTEDLQGLSAPHKEKSPADGSLSTGASSELSGGSSEAASCPYEVFYRIFAVVGDKNGVMTEQNVKSRVTSWFNQTFESWTYDVFVAVSAPTPSDSSAQPVRPDGSSYTFQALLEIKYTSSMSSSTLQESIKQRMVSKNQTLGAELVLGNVSVQPLENCVPEESPFHYSWPETQPAVTQFLPCFPHKAQSAYRTCNINWQNFTSFWSSADVSSCTPINEIKVSAENAAEVATTLDDLTHSELSADEVSNVVTKLKEIINVAKINESLASTMVNVISNVMTSSDTALASSSEIVLKTVEELVQKIELEGRPMTIISRNLAVGISSTNSSSFNGKSFSAYISPNDTDLKIDFDSEQLNPLAAVTLPATLLGNLSQAEADAVSRINFMFFSKINLFQDQKENGPSLNSYVVASSVGNLSITNLQDPVRIEITHLQYQHVSNPACVFWDFTMNNGSGGWNSTGCTVSQSSDSNRTVCLCNHLTNFGILMDISGTAALIDEQNNKILTFITYIGCGVSAICSALTLLTYIAFEKLRRDYPSKILMNLSTSLLFLNMVFLLDSWLASFDNTELCISVAVFLHYFLLTSFTWMGLESIHMYIALVKVFNTYIRRYILKFCIVGWGLPAAIVTIVVIADRNSYGKENYGKDSHGQGSSQFCWVKSQVVFYVTCVGYFSVIFLMNVAMFIVVMIQICGRNGKRSNRTLREEMLRSLRSAASLTFLLGMTWGFAFFAWGPVNLAFMYLFSIFNSLQGLFIFIFHCALKENVQKQWQRYLCCGRFRLADNSDWSKTATNNTKKVSSDNLAKSLSSCSFGSSTANWTSKAKATLNPFAKRSKNAGKGYSSQHNSKLPQPDGEASSIIPVHQVIDKVKGYCSVRSDNFYKNIIMSDSFSNSTKF